MQESEDVKSHSDGDEEEIEENDVDDQLQSETIQQ